ncbi:peptide-methionine (R)-S-oxide reductase MsrB [Flavobacterium tegetincola]|uniref:peptide-methionine (R)-S-oxide reductase MsrB n=1 Tax=Flavobacterium tegetincola TaxID=150172 RepID=UPI000425B6A9|nr:peptide-methionine (R)-S-oxide reductase MsrB [Flavobacterium tegetincola]
MKQLLYILTFLFAIISCQSQNGSVLKNETMEKITAASTKTDAQWKAELTREQYHVLREKGTERAFTGEYWNTFEEGKYVCAACSQKIFNSDSKFESDCGWPSFDKAIEGSVVYVIDNSYGMSRTEVICSNCKGHLGHIFDDGPKETTGDRFCMNSVSIKFIPAKK